MNIRTTSRIHVLIAVGLMVASSSVANACPACYGAAQNNTMAAVNNAVVTLLGVTGFVLSGIIAFAVYMWKRMRKAHEPVSQSTYVDDNGIIHIENKGTYEWNIS